jgi:hypothetical protein
VGLLVSPRRRRRLAWAAAVLTVGAGVAALAALYPEVEREPEVFSSEPADVIATPKNVPLTPEVRRATLAAAERFIMTAVRREHVGESFDLVHPSLRQGISRESWSRGEIPIVPFPAQSTRFLFDYSHPDWVGWKVHVYPEHGTQVRAMLFYIDLRRGADRRWRVSSWSPGSLAASTASSGGAGEGGNPLGIDRAGLGEGESRLSPAWLAVPVVLLGLGLGAVGWILLRDWRRAAAAERDWRAGR